MKLTRSVQFHPALFQIVPVVNVLFLVFMIFAMSSRFVLQPGVAIDLPASPFSLSPPQHPEIVSITSGAVSAIYYRDRRVTVEELSERLVAQPGQPRAVVVKADRGAPYAMVMQIMNVALRRGFSVVLAASPEPHRT